jgi:hypothetical protein
LAENSLGVCHVAEPPFAAARPPMLTRCGPGSLEPDSGELDGDLAIFGQRRAYAFFARRLRRRRATLGAAFLAAFFAALAPRFFAAIRCLPTWSGPTRDGQIPRYVARHILPPIVVCQRKKCEGPCAGGHNRLDLARSACGASTHSARNLQRHSRFRDPFAVVHLTTTRATR